MQITTGFLGLPSTATDLELVWTLFAAFALALASRSVYRKILFIGLLKKSGLNGVSRLIARDRIDGAVGAAVRQGCFFILGMMLLGLPNRPINLNEYINSSEALGLLILAAEVSDVIFMLRHELTWARIRDKWAGNDRDKSHIAFDNAHIASDQDYKSVSQEQIDRIESVGQDTNDRMRQGKE